MWAIALSTEYLQKSGQFKRRILSTGAVTIASMDKFTRSETYLSNPDFTSSKIVEKFALSSFVLQKS